MTLYKHEQSALLITLVVSITILSAMVVAKGSTATPPPSGHEFEIPELPTIVPDTRMAMREEGMDLTRSFIQELSPRFSAEVVQEFDAGEVATMVAPTPTPIPPTPTPIPPTPIPTPTAVYIPPPTATPVPVQSAPRHAGAFSESQMRALLHEVGMNPAYHNAALSVAWCESRWNPNATGALGERGLWQIYPKYHSDATYDPLGNARAMMRISSGGTSWAQWTCKP